MIKSKRKIILVGVVLAACVVVLIPIIVARRPSAADPPPNVAATSAQTQVFVSLLRQEERVVFNSLTRGDYSAFPTIYYNDPQVGIPGGYQQAIDQIGLPAIKAAVSTLKPGPVGADRGLLSGHIASAILRKQELQAWETEQARAAAEGREPNSALMPANPLRPSEWVDTQFDVFDVFFEGDPATATHATAKLAYGSRDQSETITTYTFTQVNGHWYISGAKSEPNQ